MDPTRFDAATKQFAALGSRRRLLAGLAAAALGIAGRDRADAIVCRTPGELCRGNADCCSRVCATDATGRHTCRCRTQADCPPPTNKCLAATCAGGVCGTTVGVVCTALDQCHLAGPCVPATGRCTNPAKSNGTACNDGDKCTQTDTCQGGVCTGSDPVVCTAQDQCHDVGTCNPSTGQCTNPQKANNTPCNDGDACTQTDTCQNGACVGGNPVVCPAPTDQCHTAGTCNPSTGTCSNPAKKADGTGCNDGNVGTCATCQAGVCTGGTSVPNGTACGTGGACVDSRCFKAYPGCTGCGSGDIGVAAGTGGVNLCRSRQGSGQTCNVTADCPAGEWCLQAVDNNNCVAGCPA
jgi:hypothetical protein